MAQRFRDRLFFLRSIVSKNIVLFLVILLVAVVPLAVRYYQDSRDYEIQNLASQLEFFAERGASLIDARAIATLTRPGDKQTPAYQTLLRTLQRIEREFGVDNAVVMRREADGSYTYVAIGHDGFDIRQPVHIHALFPATYKATNDTWLRGEMMHSQLFGGKVGGIEYDQFLQINNPLKLGNEVVAILMLNKFANPVAAAVRAKTMRVTALSVAILAVGLILFALISSRMLRPLKDLTAAAGQVAEGNLAITLPPPKSRDEVGRLAGTFSGMLEGLRQRDFIRDTFGRYVTREVVEELLGSPDGLRLGGEARVITLLVTDLRGFTRLAAELSPHQVLEILNRYLERAVAIIRRHRGTIDEIQGDGILAFFGAPLAGPDDPVRAVACALEMQLALGPFNAEQRRLGLPELAMGIGINTGQVIVGNIGSEQRTKYGAVGSAINTAYRIESYTIGGQILVSPDTYERVRPLVRVRGTVTAQFKGVEQPITLYDVSGLAGDYRLFLPETTEEVFAALRPPLPIACFPIEGKTVSTTAVAGSLRRLGATGADIVLETPVATHTNLKIVLDLAAAGKPYELYAKVLAPAADQGDDHGTPVHVAFTSVSEEAKAFLDECRMLAQRA
ncbi:MAG: HAMP domain-containing protein [Candidatus Rokubacteria bacterium]|nr:HAMP domain-containing protein [Candidatus Rokubacteria bacterium]